MPRNLADRIAFAIEHLGALDPVADKVADLVRPAVGEGVTRDLLSGKPLGHPAHPALVAVPMGAFISATALDVLSGKKSRPYARRLIALGILSAAPAALTGASDWVDTEQAERRVGLVHAGLNTVALTLYAASWKARGRDKNMKGAALALLGAGVLGGSGWLGGHLAYALGVGVDTTAFSHMSSDWTDVGAASEVADVGSMMAGHADHTMILVGRRTDGLFAMADRCTHRGAPLHEGKLENNCVVCPWHGSVFDIKDGSVISGPATRPQPAFQVRTVDGRIQVRREAEQSSLRTNPV